MQQTIIPNQNTVAGNSGKYKENYDVVLTDDNDGEFISTLLP